MASLPQLELLGQDVDLQAFSLEMRNKAGINVVDSITDANINRTIEGASTLTVNVEDDADHTILRSGFLGRHINVNVDGLNFTLVGVKKASRNLTLTFEDYQINRLRYYDSFLAMQRKQVTRAEFVLRMIKEAGIGRWVIPELGVVQPISDIQPGQIITDENGKPLRSSKDPNASTNRRAGIPDVVALTVKGVQATAEQIGNANTIISTGVSMGVRRKLLVCAIMTGIAESTLHNYAGGDRDSVGVFQQRRSMGWAASRNVAVDAQDFFKHAVQQDGINPNLSYNDLCQAVQHSGTPYVYGKYQAEGDAFVREYGLTGGDFSDPGSLNNAKSPASLPSTLGEYQYTRGQLIQAKTGGQYILTKENSWACMQRLAQEVNWRCFCVSGAIYFISEDYLFKSKPVLTIGEKSEGVDWIDFDFDEGKRVAIVTISLHLGRWSAPPGSIILISGMGTILNGRWLVNDVQRSLYTTQGTITLKKPLPVLPEPTQSNKQAPNTPMPAGPTSPIGPASDVQLKIVAYAQAQIGVPYRFGAEDPGIAFDCSGLVQAAYDSVGIHLPHNAYAQYQAGPQLSVVDILMPGDLVFFGPEGGVPVGHVGIYIGNGAMIDAPQTGAFVRVDDNFRNWTNPPYVGATRPWQAR